MSQQAFLRALSPEQRQQVTTALEAEDGRARLTATVGRYIDDEGRWPTDPNTATMLARQFVRVHEDFSSAQYSGAGLAPATLAGIAGAGIALGAGAGAKVLGSKLMASYYKDMLAYSTGLNPVVIKAMKRGLDQVTRGTRWEQVARDLSAPSGPSDFSIVFGDGLEQVLEREMVGTLRRLAWRGARSGLNHARGATIGDFADENPWIDSYAKAFARNQSQMSQRTIRQIIDNDVGVGNRALAERLQMLWDLTPQHAQAVENYREGLRRQDRAARSIRRLVSNYAERLRISRLRTLSTTESMTAFNLGRETQWMRAVQAGQMPVDTKKMWITGEDELVCAVCAPMDGQEAELGRPFQGEVTLMVPSAHPNCRCIIVPVSQGQMVVYQALSKSRIWIEGYTRDDGTTVEGHHRSAPGHYGPGESAVPDAIGGNKLVGAAASLLTLGRVVGTEGLVTEMRKLNQRFSRPLRRIKHGEVGKYRSRYLDMMAEGQGFRLGNENRINTLAQKMMANGYDQSQPIRMVVYTDGASIVDGAHRAQAAKRAGIRKVPVQVAHTGEAMPRPETFREEWDEMRTALLRMDARQSDDTGFETPRSERIYETWFNDIMERRGREQAAGTFEDLGVTKSIIDVEAYTREDGTSVEAHRRRIRSPGKAKEAAAYLNSLSADAFLDEDDLANRFGEFGERLTAGMNGWAASFKEVGRLRGMLEGKIDPGKLRKRREMDASLLTLQEVAQNAPANTPKLYRGMTVRAPIEEVEKLFSPGQVIDSKVASFSSSKEIADSYAGAQAWKPFRFGRQTVSMVLEPGAQGVFIEPMTRNLGGIMGDLDEWVVAGGQEVVGVKRTNANSIEVRLRPAEVVAKSLSLEVVTALLEYPFYTLSEQTKDRSDDALLQH